MARKQGRPRTAVASRIDLSGVHMQPHRLRYFTFYKLLLWLHRRPKGLYAEDLVRLSGHHPKSMGTMLRALEIRGWAVVNHYLMRAVITPLGAAWAKELQRRGMTTEGLTRGDGTRKVRELAAEGQSHERKSQDRSAGVREQADGGRAL